MAVAGARTSVEPVPFSKGMATSESKDGVSGRRIRPQADTVFDSGDEGVEPSDESPRGSRKAVNPYTWLVRGKNLKICTAEG